MILSWFLGSIICDVSLPLMSIVRLVNYLGSIMPSSVVWRSKMCAPVRLFATLPLLEKKGYMNNGLSKIRYALDVFILNSIV